MLRKHKNNTTVAIEVLTTRFVKETRTMQLHVRWWVISTKRPPTPTRHEEKLTMSLEAWHDWEPYMYGVNLETVIEEPTKT